MPTAPLRHRDLGKLLSIKRHNLGKSIKEMSDIAQVDIIDYLCLEYGDSFYSFSFYENVALKIEEYERGLIDDVLD